MVLNDTKLSQKMKNKGYLSLENKIIKYGKAASQIKTD